MSRTQAQEQSSAAPPPVRRGSQYHKALHALAFDDMHTAQLHSLCKNPGVETTAGFRSRVMQTLQDRSLVERVSPTLWRITEMGRGALQRLSGDTAPPVAAANDPRVDYVIAPMPPQRVEVEVAREADRHLLTRSPVRISGTAERLPLPIRRDGLEFMQCPSRRGNRLYYRDGRVTDMEGNPVEVKV